MTGEPCLEAEAAAAPGGLSPGERRQLRRCRLIAYGAPAAAAAVTVGIFVAHGLLRLRPWGQPVEVAVLVGNVAAGTAAAVFGVVWFHPVQARRWRAGAVTALFAPLVFALAYAAVGVALMSLRLIGVSL